MGTDPVWGQFLRNRSSGAGLAWHLGGHGEPLGLHRCICPTRSCYRAGWQGQGSYLHSPACRHPQTQHQGLDEAPAPQLALLEEAGGGFFASWFLQGFVAAVSMVAGSCFSLRIQSLVTALFGFSLPGVPPQFMHLSKKNKEEGKKIITIKKNPCDSQRWGFSRSSLASSRRAGSFNQRK